MDHGNLKILLLAGILFLSCSVKAQQVFSVDSVNVLDLDEDRIRFYASKTVSGGLLLKSIDITAEPAWSKEGQEKKTASVLTTDTDNQWQDTTGLFPGAHRLLPVSAIKPMPVTALLQVVSDHAWEAGIADKDEDASMKSRLSAYNKFLFTQQELTYTTHGGRGFGSYFSEGKKDKRKRWRVTGATLYTYCILDLGNNRRIIALTDEAGEASGYIIPEKDGYTVRLDDITYKEKRNRPERFLATDVKGNPGDFYRVCTLADGRYRLEDIWSNIVLPGTYDSVFFNSYFIVTRNGGPGKAQYNIFNQALRHLPVKEKVRQLHPYYYYLQALAGNEVINLNDRGRTVPKAKITRFTNLCGTVTSYSYRLAEDVAHGAKSYTLEATEGGSGQLHEYWKTLLFDRMPVDSRLCFINGKDQMTYDENDLISGQDAIPRLWMLLQQDKHWGIVTFDLGKTDRRGYGRPVDSILTDSSNPARYQYRYDREQDTLRTILPVEYDSIVVPAYVYNEPLRIYKNGRVGYFPLTKDAPYRSLGRQTAYFIRFTMPDGKTGWLDKRDGKEYFDE